MAHETGSIERLRTAIRQAAGSLRESDGGPEPTLDRPRQADLGDYSSNAAMLLAAPLGQPPRDVAERLRDSIVADLGEDVARVEVAGPGFINLYLSDLWFRSALAELVSQGEEISIAAVDPALKVMIEFVSANPTGPLTAAGGRHAAYGDAVARLLEAIGHQVSRENYVNDAGGQMERFAGSVAARMSGGEPPEDGYEGEYIDELARRLAEEGIEPGDRDRVADRALAITLEGIRASLETYGVRFDSWFSERTLYEAGAVEAVLEVLRTSGLAYESEGALWLRTTEFGDDKDRVLVRSNGEPTYFAADIAYHKEKLERGFQLLLNVLGADHHGYVNRMRAAITAFGGEPESFDVLLIQLVHVIEGGQRAQMSKRRGDFVSLDELVNDIGADATRFFMLQRSHDTTVDLDLELARRQSNDNPVYYVQYAHARIASILRKAGEDAVRSAEAIDHTAVRAPVEPAERALLKRLLELPAEVREAADRRAPHRLCAYATNVAADFHAFYRDCKVIGAGEELEPARLALSLTTKRAIAQSLGLLGISAPERM